MNKIKTNIDGIFVAIGGGALIGFCIYAFVKFSATVEIIAKMIANSLLR
jgi:threonine dehydratase